MRPFARNLLIGAAVIGLALFSIILQVQTKYQSRMYPVTADLQQLPQVDAIMILGASVLPDDSPSDALRDRLLVGASLYRAGRAERILITGDDGSYRTNEIEIMQKFLEAKNIPTQAILIDGQGYRTYESCKRAKSTFGLESLLVVTQRFHLGRALYLCNELGLRAYGMSADLEGYQRIIYLWERDLLSSFKAWWDLNVDTPAPPVQKTPSFNWGKEKMRGMSARRVGRPKPSSCWNEQAEALVPC